MRRSLPLFLALLGACQNLDMNPERAESVGFAPLVSPSVVLGDSLRDSAGIARPLVGVAYNIQGDPIPGFPVRYRTLDTGSITLDTVTGHLTGIRLTTSAVRLIMDARGLQSPPIQLFVVPTPDSLAAVNANDTLRYNLGDSTKNISSELTVRLLHVTATDTTPVPAYHVFFQMTYPADTSWAQMLGSGTRQSSVDTTDASGLAGRRIRIRPANLPALADSVVIQAHTRYRNASIPTTPIRLVLHIRNPN